VFDLMADQQEAFSPDDYLPAVTGYYADRRPAICCRSVQRIDADPLLQQEMFRARRSRSRHRAEDLARGRRRGEAAAGGRRALRVQPPRGLPDQCREFFRPTTSAAFRRRPTGFSGLDAVLTFNNPVVVRHIGQLAEWQVTKAFDYSGRATTAEPRFWNGECGIFIGSSRRAPISEEFPVRSRLRRADVLAGRCRRAPKHHHRAAATLWVAAQPAAGGIQGRRQILRLSVEARDPGRLATRNTGYLPITPRRLRPHARARLLRAQSRHRRSSIEQMTLKPPTAKFAGAAARLVSS